MLDELRDLFLAALRFDGNDAMPLVTRWNEAVKRVQAVFDNMTDKTVDAVPVCRCKDCIHYEMGVCLKIYDDGAANKDAWQERNPSDFCSYGEHKGGADGADS